MLDQWQRAEQRGVPTHTGFLSPAEQAVSADLLLSLIHILIPGFAGAAAGGLGAWGASGGRGTEGPAGVSGGV